MKENFKELYVVQIRVKLNGKWHEWHDYFSCLTTDEAFSYMEEHLVFLHSSTSPDMRVVRRVTYDEEISSS